MDKYKDIDVDNVVIEASRLPEILTSLVPSWDKKELETLVAAVDEDGKYFRNLIVFKVLIRKYFIFLKIFPIFQTPANSTCPRLPRS